MSDDSRLTVRPSAESLVTWANRSYITDRTREQLLLADVLIVPNEGHIDRPDLVYFPVNTEDLLLSLKETEELGFCADICIEDQDFKELALYSDVITIATIVCTIFVAPLVVNIVSDWIDRKARRRRDDVEVRSKYTVHYPTGESVDISYEGPSETYLEFMIDALQKHSPNSTHSVEQATSEELAEETDCDQVDC